MARPKNADGQRTRQAVLDAALDLFSQQGYFGTSLRDVAAAVGVRESALYNYFPGKDALFDALISAHQHGKLERLSPIVGQPHHRRPRSCWNNSPSRAWKAPSTLASRSCFGF